MKKLVKLVTLVTALALAASVAACGDIANKTEERRNGFVADGAAVVAALDQNDYTADAWVEIQALLADYEAKIDTLAAKSKMTAALREFKAAIANVKTYQDVLDAYYETVDARIAKVLEEDILPALTSEMGIKSIVYDASANHATFFINNQSKKIRNFADTGICGIFQEMFTDVYSAHIIVYEANNKTVKGEDDLTHDLLIDKAGLKHHVGQHFIRLYVENYSQAPLSYLVEGGKATAQITFRVTLPDGTVKEDTKTYSCEFVDANN
ncbi:MAG: hypothetical protein IJU84_07140 [Clostridia bacterium]|nr:hypothetical protein [Clostridia bacterium]